ncbi:protein of unknown function [Fibrobacter sp. UWB15]|uniref:DUF748 domain-containing protein n=1 Tax=unclassified Fibrobacter TaxID=2634177 RepID=UPI00091945C1|nr:MULTISPECIES: DUF748 domain-containing protein [unclassified Fibrobacter]PWJ67986.1 uncharacterized protein DUF748 [Fibrobacter sp. UWB6]SHF83750.1 protein of unknown function [Fibrobacter sp. UWB8]SMG17009.1 protein of unknown function [Fibrobacter sp. UWB15]
MKKRYIALIVLAALIVVVIAALKIAPGVAKNYVVEHSEELIGRKMKIENVEFSPFTFTVTVDDFAIFEPDGSTPFVAFEKFRINVNPTRLLAKEISVSEIYLKGLYTRVAQRGDLFNFSDILNKFAADSTADTTAAKEEPKVDATAADSAQALNLDPTEALGGFSVAIENITLEKGNIIYEDLKVGSKIHIQDFSVAIPAVYFSNKNTDIGVNLKFANGGDLGVKVQFNMKTQDFGVNVTLNKLALAVAKPYLKDFINYKDFEGTLGVDLNVAGNVNNVLSSNVSGTVSVDDIKLTETSGKAIGVAHVGVGIAKANVNEMDFRVDSVIVDGAYAHLDLLKNGKTNIDILLEPLNKPAKAAPVDTTAKDEPKTAEKSKPLKAVINKLQVVNTNVSASDHTPKQTFNYKVSNIAVNGSNINFNTPCTINVSAAFPEGGALTLKYKGALSDIGTMDAYISVKNLALKHFSPYSHHYTGYPISSGTMAFASENKMNDWNIESKNTIDIYNIDVADKDGSTDPEYMVPMKVGLYILKDKDDKIQFDVPVKGNVKDPEFSYLKIVWQTVMNLLIKVALSPLKVVGNVAATGAGVVGIDLGKNDEIYIDPLASSFTSEQFAKAQKMVEALAKDKKLKMNFVQNFNMKKTVEAYKTHKLKTDFYKATQNKTTLNELDEKAIVAIEDKDSAYAAYAAEHAKELDRKTMEKEILAMAEARNQELLKTLQQQPGVTKKNVTVTTAPRGSLTQKKAMYKVQIDVQ